MKTKKYLVISDIHGALDGAACIMEAYSHHQADAVLCLGDILYHGPRNDVPADYAPKKVIEIMNALSHNIISVRGNCEAEVDQMVLNFPCMSESNSLFLDDKRIFMTHGHIYSPDHLPPLKEGDRFLSGHTHIPTACSKDGIFLLNPGSISLPKGGHPATYAILTTDHFTIYTRDHKEYMSISINGDAYV